MMCGIFGVLGSEQVDVGVVKRLASYARQRGRDSSGLVMATASQVTVSRADFEIMKLLKKSSLDSCTFMAGHSRLVTNGHLDNQPVARESVLVLHNGIIVNTEELWTRMGKTPNHQIDSEVLPALAVHFLDKGHSLESAVTQTIAACVGVVSVVMVFPKLGKVVLASNNGSLFRGNIKSTVYFSSEQYPLSEIGCEEISQVFSAEVYEIPVFSGKINEVGFRVQRRNLVPQGTSSQISHQLLEYREQDLRRCSACILPETMPFISFNQEGLCNYCANYEPRNRPKDRGDLDEILSRYRKQSGRDCILPFSGGRDSSFGLHLAVEEFNLKPIAYTYDWGMVTDLGRRNISRMCASLGVENIIIAADVNWKRNNIRKNLVAWLRNPDLGMVSILTAGDKHFFKHVETVKRQTGVGLNLWGVNPLEVTHFKAGFLGIPPDFAEKTVYRSGLAKQAHYQSHRFQAMLKSPRYFNSSLVDTLSGEYHRSNSQKTDYYHLFDYWRWDENEVDSTLRGYDWETASDTPTTWRIGDGTAGFYNYIYHRVAGFTEHDTFRSNQIREGDLSREEALRLVATENKPRYQNIKWYLDAIGMDFEEVISRVNQIPRLVGAPRIS